MTSICKVAGCTAPARYVAACMCQKHNYRWRTHGSTDKPVRKQIPLAERLRLALQEGLARAIEVGDCLEWQGHFSCKGVTPVVKVSDRDKQRTENHSVPRLLWKAKSGEIPAGRLIFRKCCNNSCVLDDHLVCGTRKQWSAARKKAGVTKHSELAKVHLTLGARKRKNVKHTMEKAREVRLLTAAGAKVAEIARQTGVSEAAVLDIRQGHSWREIAATPFSGLGA